VSGQEEQELEPEEDGPHHAYEELAFFFFFFFSSGEVLLSAVEWSEAGVYREWGGTCSCRLVLERVSAVGWGRVVRAHRAHPRIRIVSCPLTCLHLAPPLYLFAADAVFCRWSGVGGRGLNV
jgi:hypothetical protein